MRNRSQKLYCMTNVKEINSCTRLKKITVIWKLVDHVTKSCYKSSKSFIVHWINRTYYFSAVLLVPLYIKLLHSLDVKIIEWLYCELRTRKPSDKSQRLFIGINWVLKLFNVRKIKRKLRGIFSNAYSLTNRFTFVQICTCVREKQ